MKTPYLLNAFKGFLIFILAYHPSISASAATKLESKIESEGGVNVTLSNPDHSFKLGGFLQLDEILFFKKRDSLAGVKFPNSADIRNASVNITGDIYKNVNYLVTFAFETNQVDLDDAWVTYTFEPSETVIGLGQTTPLTPLENVGQIWDYFFLETSLATTSFCIPDRVLGVSASRPFYDQFTLSGMIYGPRTGDTNTLKDMKKRDRIAEAVKVTWSPCHEEGRVRHLGLTFRHQALNHSLDGQAVLQQGLFSTPPEAVGRNTPTLIDSGDFLKTSGYNHIGAEFAIISGPLTVEAEHHSVYVNRLPFLPSDNGNVMFYGWHIQGGYVLTGESRNYSFSDGTISNPVPKGPCGALEITARLSYVNLIRKNIFGGSEHDFTLGLNWFVNKNVLIMANYILARINPTDINNPGMRTAPPLSKTQTLNIFGLRFQVVF